MNRRQRTKQLRTFLNRETKARKRSRDRHYRTAHRYRVTFYADRVQDRRMVQFSADILTHTGNQHVIRRSCAIMGGPANAIGSQILRFQLHKLAQQVRETFGPVPGIDAALEAVQL